MIEVTNTNTKSSTKAEPTGIDYQKLCQELISELRGSVSQRDLSSQLGFTYNQVGKWESGSTILKWDGFIEICDSLNKDLDESLKKCFGPKASPRDLPELIKLIVTSYNLLNSSQHETRIWAENLYFGKGRFDFIDFLKLMDSHPSMLIGWLANLVDCSNIPALSFEYEKLKKRLQLASDLPLVMLVNAALKLDGYSKLENHSDQFLCEHAGCSKELLSEALTRLTDCGVIFFDGKKFHPCPFDFSFTFLRDPSLRSFFIYLTALSLKKFPLVRDSVDRTNIKNSGTISSRATAMSKDAATKVDQLIMKFHAEVAEVVKNDHFPKDHVQIITANSYPSSLNSGVYFTTSDVQAILPKLP